MNSITKTIGVDLAKQVFAICEVDGTGRVRQRGDFRRCEFAAWLAQLPTGTVVAMEACSGAHYWARRCLAHDLIVSVKSEAQQARLSWRRVRYDPQAWLRHPMVQRAATKSAALQDETLMSDEALMSA
jgi:hypothetical protein